MFSVIGIAYWRWKIHDDQQFFVERKMVLANRTRVIPGAGVALGAINPVARPDGTPVILCISRMIRNKGILDLVEAAELLRARGLDFEVHLVGDMDARIRLR